MEFPIIAILTLSTCFIPWTIGLPSPDTLPNNSPLFDTSPFAPLPRELAKTNLELDHRQATTAHITDLISISGKSYPNKQSALFFIGSLSIRTAIPFINFNALVPPSSRTSLAYNLGI